MQNIAQNTAYSRLVPGDSLTAWRLSRPVETLFPGTARPMPDAVDYRFVNGWVATGDLPCREALRAALPGRRIALSDRPDLPEVYPGGESPRVDFSTFRFRPTLVSRWATTSINAARAQTVRLEAETCGALHLWAGSEKVLAFEPYDRNIPHRAAATFDLPEGETELTVYFDDLHERDTSCFFRLTLLDGDGLGAISPAGPEAAEAAAALADLRADRLFHSGGTVRLMTGHPLTAPLSLSLPEAPDRPTTMNVFADPPGAGARAVLERAGEAVDFLTLDGLTPGCIGLDVETEAGGAVLRRNIGVTYLPSPVTIDDGTLPGRKAAARRLMATRGQATPARALVLLADGNRVGAETLMEPALLSVEERHDCADFFLLPLLRIWSDHAGNLGTPLRARLRSAILGFRYWLDEPGNDVMWFWSENHALCFHAAQYLAGSLLPDEIFGNSGLTGAEQAVRGHARLLRWFASVEEHGLAEWNSAAYYPIDFLGLLSLVDMAPDAGVRDRAAALCDRIFAMVALHTIGGVPAGSQGRAYEKELFAGPATELGAMAAIAFGGPWHPGHDRAAALFAMSSYAPPDDLAALAAVPEGHVLEAAYVQGLDGNARLRLWKASGAQLSSVADHKTGAPGHQQHVVDLQMAADPLARVWVNHPGDLRVWGGSRPSYWAGSGVVPRVAQMGETCLMVFDLDAQDHPIGFTHAFLPDTIMDEIVAEEGWLFARAGHGYAALWASAPPERMETGLFAGSEWRAHGRRTGWILRAGSADIHGDFAAFRAGCHALAPGFDAPARRIGAGDMALAFDGPLVIAGAARPFAPLSTLPHVSWDGAPLRPITPTRKEFA